VCSSDLSGPSLECLTAYEDRFGLFVHRRDAAGVDARDFSTLDRLSLVSYGYNDAPYLVERVMDICNRRGFDTKNRIEVRSFSNLVIHINAGMGFTILPLSAAEYICTKNVVILPIRGDDTALTGAVGWNRTVKNNAAESFIGMLRAMY
jgi:DNA-binding transcriptional LysR family regulator